MKTFIISLYIFGLALLVGSFFGADHHLVSGAVCIIFATRLVQDVIEERRAEQKD